MNNHDNDYCEQLTEEEEEECNAEDDANDYSTQKIPVGQSFTTVTGKNPNSTTI